MKIKVVYLLNYEIMKIKSQNLEKKQKKKDIFRTHLHFLMVQKELILLKVEYFQ